jgi:hypothetical protein
MTDELKAASVASSPWDQATLLINGNKVEWGTAPVLLRGQENVVTVEAPPTIARALNLGLPEDGGLSIAASPDFGNWVTPVDGKFTWKITPDTGRSGRITLVFFSREVLESWEHRSLVISSNLADEADVKIGGVAVPAGGNWFYRGKAQTVTLTPKPNSPLAGLPVKLTCAIKSGLNVTNVVSAPAFGSEPTTHSWAVTGNTKSGTFQLALSGKGMTTPITLPISKLLSNNLADEVNVLMDGKEISNVDIPNLRREWHTFTLVPKLYSPLAGRPLRLQWIKGDGIESGDLGFRPQINAETVDYSWQVTGSFTKSGSYELGFSGAGFSEMLVLPVIRQIVPKYYVNGKELLDLTDFILPDRPYSLSVEVSAGVSSIYVKNSPNEFIFNPPLNRSFPVINGRVEWTFSSPAAAYVLDTLTFDYSSVYTAREDVLLFGRPS